MFKVPLSDTISTSEARGAVEKWLLQVQDLMLVSIRDIIERAVQVCSLFVGYLVVNLVFDHLHLIFVFGYLFRLMQLMKGRHGCYLGLGRLELSLFFSVLNIVFL